MSSHHNPLLPIKYAACAVLLMATLLMTAPSSSAAENLPGAPALFTAVAVSELDPMPVEPFVVRTRTVRLGLDVVGGARGVAGSELARAEMLTLQLFPDVALLAMRTNAEALSESSLVWTGMIDGTTPGLVTLSAVNGVLVGHISIDGNRYRIAYAGNGLHRILELDEQAMPQEAPPATS